MPVELACVEDQQPVDALTLLDREPQPDRPTLVVYDDRPAAHIKILEQPPA